MRHREAHRSGPIPRKRSAEERACLGESVSYLLGQRKEDLFRPASKMLGYITLGMKKRTRLFFFLEKKKCCEIVQEQPPVSTLSPASRSFYITGLTELGSGVRVGVRVRRSQRRNGGLGPVPDLQLLPLPSEPIRPQGLASHCRRRSQRSDRPEVASPPPHTPVLPWKDPLWGLLTRASLKDN